MTPVGSRNEAVEEGQTLTHQYVLSIPPDVDAGVWAIEGSVSYRHQSSSATLPVSAAVQVIPAVVVDSVALDAAEAGPGEERTVRAVLTNRTDVPHNGTLAVDLQEGWTEVAPSTFTVPASGSASVEALVEVPLTVTEGSVPVVVSVGDSALERGSTPLEVTLTSPPGGWFEFDLRVPQGEPFLLRAVKTYDRAQLKTYDVLVDGQVVHERRYQRTDDGVGSLSFQFLVTDPHVSGDGVVRIRYQDVEADYDPSIADVWSMPAP